MHLIIDGDPMVYRAGFSAEEHSYDLVVESPEGELHQLYFKPLAANDNDRKEPVTAGKQMQEWVKDHEDWKVLSKDMVVSPEPIEHALQVIRTSLVFTVNAVADTYKMKPSELDVTILLSGPGNYRDELGTIRPYKGNRDELTKPYWYQAIRDYMTEWWDAKVVEGREADDECSILARNDLADRRPYLVATIDKDLDQVPGLHYDYAKKVFYDIDEWEAEQIFWGQVLSGDSTDNIQGMYRVGYKNALSLLGEFNANLTYDPFMDREQYQADIWEYILKLYANNIRQYPDKFPEGMDARSAALETARLVFMQHYEGQLWTPPGEPDGTLEEL